MKRFFVLILALFCVGWTTASGQPWAAFLDPSRATRWDTNGVGATITNRTTACATQPTGMSTGGTAAANSSAIQTAIVAANGGNCVINLPAGTYNWNGNVTNNYSGFTIRGNGTTLVAASGAGYCGGGNGGNLVIGDCNSGGWFVGSAAVQPGGANAATVNSGYTQGSTSIVVGSIGSSGISVGQLIVMDQANLTTDNGGIYTCDQVTTPQYCRESSQTPSDNGRTISGIDYNGTQMFVVTAVTGSGATRTLTLSNPIYGNNWASGQTPGIWWPSTVVSSEPSVYNIGVENITFDYTANSSVPAGISFYDCYNCWATGIQSKNANRDHVWVYQSKNVTIADSYFFGTQNAASESYGVEDFISSDALVQNTIFQQVAEPLIGGGGSGWVEAYNFWINNRYGVLTSWNESAFMGHDAGNSFKLLEGNEGNSIFQDDIHGIGGGSNTVFRNQLSGRGYNCTVTSGTCTATALTTNNTSAMNIYYGARGHNVIGNVLGTASYHTTYQTDTTGSTTNCNSSIFVLGWGAATCTVDGGGANYPQKDTLVESTLMRWDNYDVATNAVRQFTSEGCPVAGTYLNANCTNFTTPSTTIPASLYLSAKPSWWNFPSGSASPFPAVGPDVTGGTITAGTGPNATLGGHAYPNPAMNMYFKVMSGPTDGSGTMLTGFNPALYYTSSTAANPTFSPPAGTYSSAQTVVISSATPSAFICTNTTSSAMSTTGGTSCTNGTHYTGPVTVPSSETLYAIAGATGFTDSSQVSASYNIPTSNASLPFLPKVWNDLNEETCQIPSDPSYPCYNGPNGPSPGLLLHAPQYVLTLSPTGGVFSLVQGSPMTLSGGKPPAIAVCSVTALGYTSFTFANSYMDSGNGRQQARIDVEKYRACSGGVIGGIIVLPVSASSETGTCGSYNGAKIYCAGAPGSVAPASGFYLPLTSTIQATSPIIERSLQDAVLQGKSQPVCNGGIQFNLPTSTAPGVLNDDCIGDHIAYQLGSIVYCANGIAATNNDPSTCTYTGSFVFGAKTVNTAQFNYAQYMFHASCSGLPFCETERVCSATIISNYLSGVSPLCPVSANLTYQTAADHWEIEDEGISIPPQTQNNAVLFDVGSAVQAVFPTQFANDIRCRRCWAHGDWSTLAAGTNQIAAGFGMSACNTCSVVDSSTSMMLRPGAEGHQGNSDGDYQRWENDFFSGQSSGVFAGGFSNTPATPTFTPNMDSTFARVNFYFPQSWLGINCSYNSINGNSGGNACGNIPDNNIYYGGAGDNFPSTVGLVDPCIGPLLTPPVSVPSWATCVTIDSTQVVVTYMGTGPTFHDDASFWQRTTSILFNPTYTNSYGVGTSGRCQTSLSDTKAKQCSFATWVPSCVANGGEFSSGTGCYPGSPPTSITLTYPVTGCYNLVGGVATFQAKCDGTTPQTMIVNGTSTFRKNIWEFKNAQRLLAYGIIGGNASNSGGQNAPNFVVSPRQTSGTGIEGNSYFTQDTDVLCISCYFYNSGTGFDIGGRSEDNVGDGAGASMPTQRVGLWNFMEVNVSRQNPGANTNAYGSYISTGSQAWLTGTTGGVSCTGTQCTFTAGAGINVDVAQTLNAPLESDTGITGSSSAKTVTITIPNTFVLGETISFVLTGTCLDGIPYKVTVTGNPFTAVAGTGASNCTATITTGTVQGPVGYQVFNFQKGDPVYVYGCTGGSASAINMPSNTAYSSSLNVAVQTGSTYTGYATAASTPWDPVNGWNTSMTTVTYTWATSGPVTDTFGTCTIQNGPGNPQYVTINHATFDTDSNNPLGGGANLAKSSVIQFNSAIVNSIILSNTNPAYSGYNCNVVGNCGFWDSVILPAPKGGTNTEIEQNDVTTATISRLVWPGLASGTCTTTPTAPWNEYGSCTYTPYNNNPLFPAGLSMFFPPTQCNVGFVGTPPWQFGCTGNIVPLSPNDYHQLALYPGSTYSGTCIGIPCGPAADGSDEGAIITGTGFNGSSIDDAQTRLLFACTMAGASYASQCWPSAGTNPGPFPYSNNVVPPTITDIVIQGKPVFKGKPVIK